MQKIIEWTDKAENAANLMDQETGRSADLSRSHFVPVDMHILVYILSPR